MREFLSCALFCTLLGAPAFGQLPEWGLDEYSIATDYRFDGSLWHYSYDVSAALNGVAIYSFEIATDPLVNPAVALQSPVLPAGWTATATSGKIRFETTTDPIPPNATQHFEYVSPLNPGVLNATVYHNPPVWFGNAMGPSLVPFNNRQIGVWVNLGGGGAWVARQAMITKFVDLPNDKEIVADFLGKVPAANLNPPIPGAGNMQLITRFHTESSGVPTGPGALWKFEYDYLAENRSNVNENSAPLGQKFSLYTFFASKGWPSISAPP